MDHTQSPVQSNSSAVAHQHTGGCGPPLHWGYGNTTAHIHYAPLSQPPTTSLQIAPSSMVRLSSKRPLSESDDNDDLYSESSKDKCMSPSNSGNCEMLSRKKRRGVIEKKRRDRINTSLSELKRLVPSAFEKQGSAKLEKAEILQLTVDHLKTIHAKGYDSISYDSPCSAKFAMDYHGMGYRDCAAEVSRYLERIEGLDGQNPLRLRLVAHLQTCAVQREKSASAGGTMPAAAPVPPPASASWPPYVGAVTSASAPAPVSSTSHDNQSHNLQMHAQAQSSHTHSHHPQYTDLQPYHHAPMYQHQYMPTMDASAAFHNHHHSPHGPQGTTTTSSSAAAAAASAAAAAAAAMKPYRPWGAELAY